jgi:hypothetical protein
MRTQVLDLRRAAASAGWSLCIGAGTSWPAFPSWKELVQHLVTRDPLAKTGLADTLLDTYSADSLIEAARARLGLDEVEFTKVLSDELYAGLKTEAADRWPDIVQCLEANSIGAVSKSKWLAFRSFFNAHPHWRTLTGVTMAPVVAETLSTEFAPHSILSFNAEPLFLALINSEIASRHAWTSARGFDASPKKQLDKLIRATSSRTRGRIPYVFCHGLVPVSGGTSHHANTASADKLVFSESQHLALANSIVSWQATTFVEACMLRQIVFVGVSLSDPNMRHWLSRAAQNKKRELHEVFGHDGDFVSHYWINKRPDDDAHAAWLEESVKHLGVRVVWVDQWPACAQVLRRALRL